MQTINPIVRLDPRLRGDDEKYRRDNRLSFLCGFEGGFRLNRSYFVARLEGRQFVRDFLDALFEVVQGLAGTHGEILELPIRFFEILMNLYEIVFGLAGGGIAEKRAEELHDELVDLYFHEHGPQDGGDPVRLY